MTRIDRRYAGAFVVVLALGGLVLFGTGAPWRGEWNWTLDHAVGSTVLTGPAISFLAAWLSAEQRQRATLHDSTVRGWLVPARAAGIAAGIGILGFGLALAAAVLATATVDHGGPFTWWFLGIVPPLCAAYATLGAIAGHFVPHRVVVVLTGPAMFIAGMLADLGLGPNVLRQGPTSGSLAGTVWDPSVVAYQAAVLIGVTVLAVIGPALVLSVVPRLSWPTAAAGIALAMIGLVGLERGGDYSLEYSDERPTACAGRVPRVCVAPSNQRSLEPVSRQFQRVGKVLTKAGAPVPETYLAALPTFPGRHGDGFFTLPSSGNIAHYSLLEAAQAVTTPEPCAAWYGEIGPPVGAYVARELIATWILDELGQDLPGFSEQVDKWVREASAADQRKWVVRLFDQLRTCQLAEIRMPWRR